MEILIHLASLILALLAAVAALRLIRLTGHSHAWLFLALGFVLLAVERTLELFSERAMEYSLHELASDVLMLGMAALYLYGTHRMRAIFLEHQAAREALQHDLDDLRRFQRLSVGRELRMKELVEENTALLNQLPPPRKIDGTQS